MKIHAPGYKSVLFNPSRFQLAMAKSTTKIRRLCKLHGINTLAGKGQSGMLALGVLSFRLNLPMIVVRGRLDESFHDDNGYVNGAFSEEPRYLIVDDMISSGKTVQDIGRRIAAVCPRAVCVGVFCYFERPFYPEAEVDGRKVPNFF